MSFFLIRTLPLRGFPSGLGVLLEVPQDYRDVRLIDLEYLHPNKPHRLLEPPCVGERVIDRTASHVPDRPPPVVPRDGGHVVVVSSVPRFVLVDDAPESTRFREAAEEVSSVVARGVIDRDVGRLEVAIVLKYAVVEKAKVVIELPLSLLLLDHDEVVENQTHS